MKLAICWSYAAYMIVWEALIFGGAGYAVFGLGRSGWWFVAALLISATNWSPEAWLKLWSPAEHPTDQAA